MKKQIAFFIFHFSFFINLSAQPPAWTQTDNPSAGSDVAYAITADASGIYVAGVDESPGNPQWRIEKRDLTTGALIAAFGTGGVVTINPSASSDFAYAITANTSGIYVAGYDNSPGNNRWRIEKRDLSTGALIAAFGTGGVVTNNLSAGIDVVRAITIDASGIYVAGYDAIPGNIQWRIEKRDLTTGALIAAFGTGGIVTSNPSVNWDAIYAITANASGIYVAGYDNTPGNPQWRIEKRNLTTGALIAAFGTGGVVTNNLSAGSDAANAITADTSGIYVAGDENSSVQWRIEKRDLTTGALIAAFGTGGVVTSNPSTGNDVARAITSDTSGIYVAGSDAVPSSANYQWRIEKRDLTDGTLLCTVTSNPSASNDVAYAITADASGIYVAGYDAIPGPGDYQWRIEKYDLCGLSGFAEPSDNKNELFVYPSVSSGEFAIQLATGNWQLASSQKPEASVEIYNILGKNLYSTSITNQSIIINLDAPGGIYLLNIKTEKEIITRKIIIQKL